MRISDWSSDVCSSDLVTADEISDPHALDVRCLVNGELRQSSNTGMMLANIFEQIEYLSTAFTLEPGDLIATGTPEGVGIAMDPPTFLKVGDVVRCEIDGIGAIENDVIDERPYPIYLPCNARNPPRHFAHTPVK